MRTPSTGSHCVEPLAVVVVDERFQCHVHSGSRGGGSRMFRLVLWQWLVSSTSGEVRCCQDQPLELAEDGADWI